jgi:hypothetical protein
MTLAPIVVACPQCGSNDIFYSCKPECCFNHVCNACYTTFELATTRVGEFQNAFDVPPDPDSTAPTAPCARCGECKIFALGEPPGAPQQYLCVSCQALLTLEITNVVKG